MKMAWWVNLSLGSESVLWWYVEVCVQLEQWYKGGLLMTFFTEEYYCPWNQIVVQIQWLKMQKYRMLK